VLGFILLTAVAFAGDIGLGFDYTDQRYVAIEEDTARNELFGKDTVELETEARLFWNAAVESRGLSLDNSLNVGSSVLADQLKLDLALTPTSRFDITLADEADARIYHRLLPGLADTSWQRSTIGNTGRLGLAFRPGAGLTLSAGDELEYGHYLDPDSLNRDHLTNRVECGARRDLGDLSTFSIDYSWARRFGTALRYAEHAAGLDIDCYFEPGPHCQTTADLTRRLADAGSPGYWELAPSASFDLDLTDNVTLTVTDELLATRYDSTSLAYTDALENRLRLESEIRSSADFSWHGGIEFGSSRSLPDKTADDFREAAVILGLDLLKSDRLWLSLEDRLGRRAYEPGQLSLSTDYVFNDLSLLLDWTIIARTAGALELVTTADLSPEWHERRIENLTSRILTFELKWRY
jgi:hypothetical protein